MERDDEALELIRRLEDSLGGTDPKTRTYLSTLKDLVTESKVRADEQANAIAAFQQAYEKLTQPANRVATVLQILDDGTVAVTLGDTEYVATVDPALDLKSLQPGTRVRLNEAYAVVGPALDLDIGTLSKVAETLEDGRLRVGTDQQNAQGRLVRRSHALEDATIHAGDEVRIEPTGRLAIEHFGRPESKEYFAEDVPPTPWSSIGGQESAIALIRETIEAPRLYPELYQKYDKRPIKGVLLFGPPGCGKTLIGKAIAWNLARERSAQEGHEVKECFLHISGPKILNMWLGETERMVREIFSIAREKSKEGQLVVIFIDEAESILRTRSSGRWLNISNTVVPQFCAEMDGLIGLDNVVLVLTSNRPDYIDPAILRPERIDRKVKISRPDKDSTRAILNIYLHDKLPIDPALVTEHDEPECARRAMIEATLTHVWQSTKKSEFVRVMMKNGSMQVLHWCDFVSGALLKSVVDRAKDTAIRREIDSKHADGGGLKIDDLQHAVESEFAENEIFPKTDAMEDWLKLLDFEPESVAAVKPIGPAHGRGLSRTTVV
ncbi:MAG: AAA family ATPase [Chthonomonadaceae bacterium]|nr:AAA family ATPase [Chthonomonadaceae bacterium]